MNNYNPNPNYNQYGNPLPKENEPLSPWNYFWLSVLYTLPVLGFIMLIVHSCSSANINRRNFARSHFCGLLIAGIIVAAYVIIMLIFVGASGLGDVFSEMFSELF